ncbi:hypothetical protein [Helicobacter salomonis]|uniref:hypothetical protein n=1 Tax=Helicobacter salomonis TaxID=56878 RepID=UPI00131572E1|nr:hypothetical protein [Helicobacter salomonis]
MPLALLLTTLGLGLLSSLLGIAHLLQQKGALEEKLTLAQQHLKAQNQQIKAL